MARRARQAGKELVSTWRPGESVRHRDGIPEVDYPPRGGVRLVTTPRTPEAQQAFRGELNAHLDAVAARVAAEEAAAGEESPPVRGARNCWACGRWAPSREKTDGIGWAVRHCPALGAFECYCPECFQRWGWPDVGDPTAAGE